MSYQPSNTLPISVPHRLKQPRWLVAIALIASLLVAVPLIRSQTSDADEGRSEEPATAPLPVETITVESSSGYTVARTYTGEVTAAQASELGFERSGQLTQMIVAEGVQVSAGEPLAQLDIRNLRTQRMQIEAEKARAIAQLSELETGARTEDIAAAAATVRDLEQQVALQSTRISRRERLYSQGAISREDFDEVSFTGGSLQARLDQARSQLAALQNGTRPEQLTAQDALVQQLDARLADLDVTISKSTLYAPFSGTVAEHKVDTGTVVGAGQSVVRLVENSIPEARVGVPADVVQTLSVGEATTVDINGEEYTATIVSILPEVEAQTRTQTVVLNLEARAAANTSPGQTVRLNLSERIQADGIWVPTEALTQGIRGLWSSYVVVPAVVPVAGAERAGKRVEKRVGQRVEKGAEQRVEQRDTEFVVEAQSVEVIYQEGDRAYVTGTLQPGDKLVASGTHRLVPGQAVSLAAEQ